MIVTGIVFVLFYVLILGGLLFGYNKQPYFNPKNHTNDIGFSILIPFRNETKNIPQLINSLNLLNYPTTQFEVLFIDDESEDDSVLAIKRSNPTFTYRVLKNERYSNSPKKDAITLGVSRATFDWILTTDADCRVPQNWLAVYSTFIEMKKPVFIAGGVTYVRKNGFIYDYQQLENLSLQTTTIGGFGLQKPLLCNGANMGYRKEVFDAVNGYTGNNALASGDDVFLLEKVWSRYPNKTAFVKSKEVVVTTLPVNSWKDLLEQRVRWASKTSSQKSIATKLLGIIIFFTNYYILMGAVFCFIKPTFVWFFMLFTAIKFCVDYLFVFKTALFYAVKLNSFTFLKSFMVYPFSVVFSFFKSFDTQFEWKGRRFTRHK